MLKKEPWSLQGAESLVAASEPYWRRLVMVLLILAVPTLGFTVVMAGLVWLYYRLTRIEWILTDRRLIVVRGWLTREAKTVSLDKINEVNYRRSFWDRVLFATGTVVIESAATAGVTVLNDVADDDPLRAALDAQIERRRRRPVSAP